MTIFRRRGDGLYQPARTVIVSFDAPEDVELERIEPHQTLSQMLLDGEIDALIGPRA